MKILNTLSAKILPVLLGVVLFFGCSDDSHSPLFPYSKAPVDIAISFSGWEVDSVDEKSNCFYVSPKGKWKDSLTIDSLVFDSAYSLYLTLDEDPFDPALGEELVSKQAFSTLDAESFSFVMLDKYDRIVALFKVVWGEQPISSSSKKDENSSSSKKEKSSSSMVSSSSISSSSSVIESSSSEKVILSSEKDILKYALSLEGKPLEVSFDEEEKTLSIQLFPSDDVNKIQVDTLEVSEGASFSLFLSTPLSWIQIEDKATYQVFEYAFEILAEDSSSVEWKIRALQESFFRLSSLTVENGTINVEGEKVYVEVEYGTDLSEILLSPLDTTNDLRNEVSMNFLDDNDILGTYRVIAGVQLPGSHFEEKESFWATTSEAMATSASSSNILSSYTCTGNENLTFEESSAILSTQEVQCKTGSIFSQTTTSKMAGGFYFSGTYSGTDVLSIYDVNHTSGTPSKNASDFSSEMSIGQPFSARPSAFELTYAYEHVENASSEYPQKGLVYVILVSEDNKAIAIGAILDEESVSLSEKRVALDYGEDKLGILESGFAGTSDLTLGEGSEVVQSIRVMFASSAYGHVAASDEDARGGENSTLTLEQFKLIY